MVAVFVMVGSMPSTMIQLPAGTLLISILYLIETPLITILCWLVHRVYNKPYRIFMGQEGAVLSGVIRFRLCHHKVKLKWASKLMAVLNTCYNEQLYGVDWYKQVPNLIIAPMI